MGARWAFLYVQAAIIEAYWKVGLRERLRWVGR